MASDIQFNEDRNIRRLYTQKRQHKSEPKMIQFLVERGWAKDEKTAAYILMGVICVLVIMAFVAPAIFGNDSQEFRPEDNPALNDGYYS